LDYINDVYFGKLNPTASVKTRERIHWICKRAIPTKILDIGCSQGIADILMAREGMSVIGVDICEESIESANSYKEQEIVDVQNRLSFVCSGFLEKDFEVQTFDTVVMSEVLEHLVQPISFVNKAYSLLKEGGIFIVTVPFAIMDHPDHKTTFYLIDILDLIEPKFEILELEIIDDWIALVCKKRNEEVPLPLDISRETVKKMEKKVYLRERALLDSIEILKNRAAHLRLENEVKELKFQMKLKENFIKVLHEKVDAGNIAFNKVQLELIRLKCDEMLKDKELLKDINNSRNIFEKVYRVYRKDGIKRVVYKTLKKLKLRK